MSRALVLGGGGPVGIAWESGIVAGLAEHGIALAEADLVIGTSAGSVVGSQLALGRSPQSLLAAQLASREAGDAASSPASSPAPNAEAMLKLMELMEGAASGGQSSQDALAEIGAFALAADTMSEQAWLATFGRVGGLGNDSWPATPFMCTAVDAEDGSFVTWDRDSGVALGRAVASSCTVPGFFPPVTINGRRYIDGGMRSATNADLAKGYDRVLVVAVTVGSRAPGNMAEVSKQRLDAELATLRDAGCQVELIVPDEASSEAFGVNLMDPSRRPASAEAGLEQGRREAGRIREGWV